MIKNSILLAIAAAGLSSLQAGTAVSTVSSKDSTPVQAKEESIYDKIWSLAQLYKNDSNPIIEEFDLTGRFQMDYFNVNSSRGDNDFFEIRRFRLGFDSWWADRHVQLKATMDTNLRSFGAESVFYNRFTDLFIKFHINDSLDIRVGKFEPHFGYDREFTDNLHKFFERSFYDDQLIGGNDYLSGAEISGKFGKFGYLAAVYSTNVGPEFGDFNGGQAYHAEINYDFSKDLGVDKALWVLDYLHADGKNANTNAFTNFSNAVATYYDYKKGKFCLVSQVAYGEKTAGKGDVYEFMIMPSYMVTDKMEFIVRYQLGLASNDNGIGSATRQERTVGKFTGDTYNAGYVGLNYYLYGQKLKLMLGEQYADLSGGTGAAAGCSSWTTLVGLRMFF